MPPRFRPRCLLWRRRRFALCAVLCAGSFVLLLTALGTALAADSLVAFAAALHFSRRSSPVLVSSRSSLSSPLRFYFIASVGFALNLNIFTCPCDLHRSWALPLFGSFRFFLIPMDLLLVRLPVPLLSSFSYPRHSCRPYILTLAFCSLFIT